MTPERERLLDAVAEAAEKWRVADPMSCGDEERAICDSLSALRAHDAAPQVVGETVEVRANVWRNSKTGAMCAVLQEDDDPEEYDNEGWALIATITARVPLPVVPTLPATVEEVKR